MKERFEAVENRAAFARAYDVPGGQAMIYQHITGRRPMSLEAARCYARGFGVELEEISPRLSQEAKKALGLNDGGTRSESQGAKSWWRDSPSNHTPDMFSADLVRRALISLEQGLQDADLELAPEKKAEALVMACVLMKSTAQDDNRPVIARLLKLVA